MPSAVSTFKPLRLCLLLWVACLSVACSTAPIGVMVSVRDKTTQTPVAGPEITVSPIQNLFTQGSPETTETGNAMGVARFELIPRGAKYFIILDAPHYDLQTVELPSLGPLFPSGKWLDTESGRVHAINADQQLQVMVSVEPR
ncbi:MAG: hypothetical protein V3V20_10835 [Algisphaera sp.]